MSDDYAPEIITMIKRLQDRVEQLGVVEGQSIKACEVYHNANQSIAIGTLTVLAFNTEVYDRGGFHDPGTNSRLYVPAEQDGIYVVSLNVYWETDGGASNFRQTAIRLNGASDIAGDSRYSIVGGTTLVSISAMRQMVAGDYVEATVFHLSGAARNILATTGVTPYFAIAQVARTV